MCMCTCVSVDILLRRKSSFARVMTKPRCWTTLGGLLLAVVATVVPVTHGCTNVLVTPEATTDGSAMRQRRFRQSFWISVSLSTHPRQPEGTMREIYEWDTGVSILCLATHTRAPSCSTTLFLLNSHQQTRTHTHTHTHDTEISG